MTDLNAHDPWRWYRPARAISIGGTASFALGWLVDHFVHVSATLPRPLLDLGFCLFAVVVVAGLYCKLFACPRCGHQFFMRWNLFEENTDRCVSCGLPQWADASGAKAKARPR